MPREVQYIAPTERKKINRKEAVKIFLAHNGRCCNCTRQINADTEDWFIEHPEALILGGSDGSDNRRPAHVECKAHKDAADATARSERDAAIARNWQRDDGAPRQSGFRKIGRAHV